MCRQHRAIGAKAPSNEDTSSSISDAFSSTCFGHIFTRFTCHVFLTLQDVEDASFQPTSSSLIPLILLVPEGTAETANNAIKISASNLKGQPGGARRWCDAQHLSP